MLASSSTIYVTTTLVVLSSALLYRLRSKARSFPPGPPGHWLWGNLRQISQKSSEPWRIYAKWSETYGSLIFLRMLTRKVLVINSYKDASALLDSRSNVYSDRPKMWMVVELAGRSNAVFFTPYHAPRFKKYRKLLNSGLSPRSVQNYQEVQEQEVRTLLKGLSESPDDFISHLRRNAGAVILKIAYGYTVQENDDPFVAIMTKAILVQRELAAPGRWLVELFPALRFVPSWFPGAYFKRFVGEAKKEMGKIETIPFNWTKEQMENGKAMPSFTSRHLREEAENKDIIRWCSAALYAGGSDTTVSAMTTFFFCMVLFPDVQEQAQAEIENLLGGSRLPSLDDKESLPYTAALVKEVLRYLPVTPLGVPHCTSADDFYKGYFIPKGTTVLPNHWAMLHDENTYPEPSRFKPERHLGSSPQMDPRDIAFGFGRRVCPGAHFAELSLFLNIACILATFDIGKAVDGAGKELDPEVGYVSGSTTFVTTLIGVIEITDRPVGISNRSSVELRLGCLELQHINKIITEKFS